MWSSGESHVPVSFYVSKWWAVIQLQFRSSATPNWLNLSVCYHAGTGLCLPGIDITCFFSIMGRIYLHQEHCR